MMAKRFFYVCAGPACLVASYHLGARNATAQGGYIVEVATITDGAGGAAAVGRTIHRTVLGPMPQLVPGTSPVVGVSSTGMSVILASGDIYEWDGNIPGWVLTANIIGGGTQAQQESWGTVKARYRDAGGGAERRDR